MNKKTTYILYSIVAVLALFLAIYFIYPTFKNVETVFTPGYNFYAVSKETDNITIEVLYTAGAKNEPLAKENYTYVLEGIDGLKIDNYKIEERGKRRGYGFYTLKLNCNLKDLKPNDYSTKYLLAYDKNKNLKHKYFIGHIEFDNQHVEAKDSPLKIVEEKGGHKSYVGGLEYYPYVIEVDKTKADPADIKLKKLILGKDQVYNLKPNQQEEKNPNAPYKDFAESITLNLNAKDNDYLWGYVKPIIVYENKGQEEFFFITPTYFQGRDLATRQYKKALAIAEKRESY